MINKEKKTQIIEKHKNDSSDAGSSEIQISLFTARIQEIAEHLKGNKKDHSALRGLQQLVAKRKKLMSYLQKKKPQKYVALIKELGIRG
jgi:small subunit ribosomal protein S15